jgi:hypothetical protein
VTYSDPYRDGVIAELRQENTRLQQQLRTVHDLWRAGLHEAERQKSWAIVAALSGDAADDAAGAAADDCDGA